MSILNRIEAEIGTVQNWPQDILRGLFYIRRPTPFMIIAIIKFLFGNKISLDDALELFDVFSKQSLQYEDLIHTYYDLWSTSEKLFHMGTYYNMRIGRMVYINGSDLDQLELVDVDPNEIKIGFGDFFPDFVRDKIQRERVRK